MDNTVTISGNLTRDPELRFTPAGQPVANLGVAVNRRFQRNGQKWEESTSFFDVAVFGDMAQNVTNSVTKGARLTVTGRLEQRSWEQDGNTRYAVQIVAEDVAVSLRFAQVGEVKRITKQQDGTPQANRPSASSEEPF